MELIFLVESRVDIVVELIDGFGMAGFGGLKFSGQVDDFLGELGILVFELVELGVELFIATGGVSPEGVTLSV